MIGTKVFFDQEAIKRRMLKALVLITFTFTQVFAWADPLIPFKGPSTPVTLEDVQPHFERPECRNNEFYSEWWSFVFVLEGGYGAYAQFVISNLGPGDGKGAVRADLDTPEGVHFAESQEYEPGQWSYAKDHFELRFGENSVAGPLEGLTLRLKNQSFEAEFRLKNLFPPWKPGNGHAQYGKSADRYYEIQLIAPVAKVEGRIKLEGEDEERSVKGLMYVDHSISTIGMHEQARRWIRVRSLGTETAFFLTRIEPPPQYGDTPVQYAALFSDGKLVFESLDLEVKVGGVKPDEQKSGYEVPWVVEAKASLPAQKGGEARIAIKATKMTSREDYLETVGAAKRFVLSKFAKPIMYYFDALYAIEVFGEGTAKKKFGGKARYYYTVVNP